MKRDVNKRPSRQRGMTFWGMAFNALVLGAVLVLVLRVVPSYMTYLSVKDIVERAATEFDPSTDTLQDIRVRIRKLLNTNQVYDIKAEDIEVYRDKGMVVIDATYEVRFPLIWIIDGVMVFDQLVVKVPGRR
jgi:cell division protein FtsL